MAKKPHFETRPDNCQVSRKSSGHASSSSIDSREKKIQGDSIPDELHSTTSSMSSSSVAQLVHLISR